MRSVGILGLAGAALAALAAPSHHAGRTRYPVGHKPRKGGSIAERNRNTGGPHKHEREIARRKRQHKRRHMKYMMNGGFSRRGNEVGPI